MLRTLAAHMVKFTMAVDDHIGGQIIADAVTWDDGH